MIYLRMTGNRMLQVTFENNVASEIFNGQKKLINLLNKHIIHSTFHIFQSEKSILAISSNTRGLKDIAVSLKDAENEKYTMESCSFLENMPLGMNVTPIKTVRSIALNVNVFNKIDCAICADNQSVYTTSKIKFSVPNPSKYILMTTSHGDWYVPRTFENKYHDSVCIGLLNAEKKPLLEFLDPKSEFFCQIIFDFMIPRIGEKAVLLNKEDGSTYERFLFSSKVFDAKWLTKLNSYDIYEKIPSNTQAIFAYQNQKKAYLRSSLNCAWNFSFKTFTVFINSMGMQLNLPIWLALQLCGHTFNNNVDMIKCKAAIPKSIADILKRHGTTEIQKDIKGDILKEMFDFELGQKDGKPVLYILRSGIHYLIEVIPSTTEEKLHFSAVSQSEIYPTFISMKYRGCLKRKDMIGLLFKNKIKLHCSNLGVDMTISNATNLVMELGSDPLENKGWALYSPLPLNPKNKIRILYSEIKPGVHVAITGKYHTGSAEFTAVKTDINSEGIAINNKEWLTSLMTEFHCTGVTAVEFETLTDLSDYDAGYDCKRNHQLLSITSYAYHSKTECYVDLLVRSGIGYFKFRYGFMHTENVPNRMLKAYMEAMAIRHCLIEHYCTPQDILKGSNQLRLDVSSGSLFAILKGQQEPSRELWHLVRYLTVRGYDARITLNNEAIQNPTVVSRIISLAQSEDVMAFDESIQMRGTHYLITRHAILRSEQRRFGEGWHSAWGFIASKMLANFSCIKNFEALNRQESSLSAVYISPDNWNFVIKNGPYSYMKSVATLYEGRFDNQIYDAHIDELAHVS